MHALRPALKPRWRIFALAVIPVLVIFLQPFFVRSLGPKFVPPYVDPEYPYILNALAVAKGSYPGHLDHPGATVHALGAAALGLSPGGTDVLTVLRAPELFGARIAWALVACTALLIFGSGLLVAGTRGFGTLGGVFFQAWPFLFMVTWGNLPRVAPDFLLLGLTMMLPALLIRFRAARFSAVAVGVTSGMILATKLSALLVLLLPAWAWRKKWREALCAYGIGAVSFWALLVPIYWGHVKYFIAYYFKFVVDMATHKGPYGGGEKGLPSLAQLGGNLQYLLGQIPVFALGTLVGCLFFLPVLRRSGQSRDAWIMFVFLPVAQLALVAKGGEPRYVIPAFACSALMVLFLTERMAQPVRGALLGVVACVAAFTGLHVARAGQAHRALVEETAKPIPMGAPRICFATLGVGVDCGLAFGNPFSHYLFADELAKLYPGHLHWDGNSQGQMVSMGAEPISLERVLRTHEAVYFFGRDTGKSLASIAIPGLRWEKLPGTDFELSAWKVELEASGRVSPKASKRQAELEASRQISPRASGRSTEPMASKRQAEMKANKKKAEL